MNNFDIELQGIYNEVSIELLLNESNRFNYVIKGIDESVVQESLSNNIKTIKNIIIKFFKFIIKKIWELLKNIIKKVKEFYKEFKKSIIEEVSNEIKKDDFSKALKFFISEYKGNEIEFGDFYEPESATTIMQELSSRIKYTIEQIDFIYENNFSIKNNPKILNIINNHKNELNNYLTKQIIGRQDITNGSTNMVKEYYINDRLINGIRISSRTISRYFDVIYKNYNDEKSYINNITEICDNIKDKLEKHKQSIIDKLDSRDEEFSNSVVNALLDYNKGIVSYFSKILIISTEIEEFWKIKTKNIISKMINKYNKISNIDK